MAEAIEMGGYGLDCPSEGGGECEGYRWLNENKLFQENIVSAMCFNLTFQT